MRENNVVFKQEFQIGSSNANAIVNNLLTFVLKYNKINHPLG